MRQYPNMKRQADHYLIRWRRMEGLCLFWGMRAEKPRFFRILDAALAKFLYRSLFKADFETRFRLLYQF